LGRLRPPLLHGGPHPSHRGVARMWDAGGGAEGQPQDPAFDALVQQVKNVQKEPAGAEQWSLYTAQVGTRDPARHGPEFLQQFLVHLHGGGSFAQQQDFSAPDLSLAIHTMMTKSKYFLMFWKEFTAHYGGGANDPQKHGHDFHAKFLDFMASMSLGHNATQALQGLEQPAKRMRYEGEKGAGGGGKGGRKGHDDGGGGARNGKGGPPGGYNSGGAGHGSSLKDAMVRQIRQFRFEGQAQDALWTAYSDSYLGGTRDPSRVEEAELLDFIQTQMGVPGAAT